MLAESLRKLASDRCRNEPLVDVQVRGGAP